VRIGLEAVGNLTIVDFTNHAMAGLLAAVVADQ
jgi:hypothetical protein